MRMRRLGCAVMLGIVLSQGYAALPQEPDGILADELALKAVGLSTDGPGLLAFFRQRASTNVDRDRMRALVEQLGHKDVIQREQATAELLRVGPATIPWLQQAARDFDSVELSDAARRCLKALRPPQSSELASAAARLLARRSPSEATAVLLAYAPVADDDSVLDDVRTTLTALAYRDGKPDPALVAALQDPVALRRALGVDALGDRGIAQPRPAFRRLLEDANPIVRYRAAVALANAREAQAVSTLITLLAELPSTQAREAEEYLLALAGEQSPSVPFGETAEARQKCRDAWATWWKATEGPGLLDEVRRRTFRPADNDHVVALVRQLGDDKFAARQEAQTALKAMGKGVIPALRHATNDPDLEISTRARQVLLEIDRDSAAPISSVILRLVAFRKPAGAAEALLAFLAHADDGNVPEDLRDALNAVAYATGQPDPAIQKAVGDGSPMVRAAAAEALCQRGMTEKPAQVVALLKDHDAMVRARAALALTSFANRDSVPVLIDSLTELSPDRTSVVEDYLQSLAGEQSPMMSFTSGTDSRQKRRDAWAGWWKEHGAKTTITAWSRVTDQSRYHGYTLLTLPQSGQVVELGLDGKTRWQLTGLSNPFDVEVLPGNRILVAEYGGGRVSERNVKGEILWQRAVNHPLGCQRLPNGNTFIVMRDQLLEVDRGGKEVASIKRPNHDVMAARKLRDGQVALVTQNACIRTDATGKELKSFGLPNGPSTYYVDITPKGNILIPQSWTNKVFEYDADGKTIGEVNAQQPMAAARLPNGNTLVASQVWPPKVLEVDRAGKTVWEHQPATHPGRIKRR